MNEEQSSLLSVLWQSFNAFRPSGENYLTVCLFQSELGVRAEWTKSRRVDESLISGDYFCSLETLEPDEHTVSLSSGVLNTADEDVGKPPPASFNEKL